LIEDDSLVNELNFCFADSMTSNLFSHIENFKDSTVLIRGANSQIVNKILSKMHFDFDEKSWLKAPAMGLVLEHIYGV
jgi:hypothetical protein